jgi:hypothetical protein
MSLTSTCSNTDILDNQPHPPPPGVTLAHKPTTPDKHEFFPQPGGTPPWCFCRTRSCPGWAAYVTWHQDATGEADEPDNDETDTHHAITKVLANLVHSYSKLFGADVDFNTALDLAGLEATGELERACRQGRATHSVTRRQSSGQGRQGLAVVHNYASFRCISGTNRAAS